MVEKSAVAEHAWENHYLVHWEQTTVLDHGGRQELLVKEALHIQITPSEECFFTFAVMTTGAFSQNIGKLFSKLKLVTDNLLFIKFM